jgi:hypothetical protein
VKEHVSDEGNSKKMSLSYVEGAILQADQQLAKANHNNLKP